MSDDDPQLRDSLPPSDDASGVDEHRVIEREVAARERRRLKAEAGRDRSVWFGLGMMGLVGWSVALPAVIGTAIGLWIDTSWPSEYSWCLMLMIAGVAVGCLNAWNWIRREGELD
jgi:ATP synthase protein I